MRGEAVVIENYLAVFVFFINGFAVVFPVGQCDDCLEGLFCAHVCGKRLSLRFAD